MKHAKAVGLPQAQVLGSPFRDMLYLMQIAVGLLFVI